MKVCKLCKSFSNGYYKPTAGVCKKCTIAQRKAYYTANKAKIEKRRGLYNEKMKSLGYGSYIAARRRCNDPNHHHYSQYGGRGIEFRFSTFDEFLALLGPRPEGYSLDRINTDGHYESGNVRWATNKQQSHNRRDNILDEDKVALVRHLTKYGVDTTTIDRRYKLPSGYAAKIIRGELWN